LGGVRNVFLCSQPILSGYHSRLFYLPVHLFKLKDGSKFMGKKPNWSLVRLLSILFTLVSEDKKLIEDFVGQRKGICRVYV
jgi:hypothetical protein